MIGYVEDAVFDLPTRDLDVGTFGADPGCSALAVEEEVPTLSGFGFGEGVGSGLGAARQRRQEEQGGDDEESAHGGLIFRGAKVGRKQHFWRLIPGRDVLQGTDGCGRSLAIGLEQSGLGDRA